MRDNRKEKTRIIAADIQKIRDFGGSCDPIPIVGLYDARRYNTTPRMSTSATLLLTEAEFGSMSTALVLVRSLPVAAAPVVCEPVLSPVAVPVVDVDAVVATPREVCPVMVASAAQVCE